jgi:septal ring factor EnvC (AmiA/AmiB activator)
VRRNLAFVLLAAAALPALASGQDIRKDIRDSQLRLEQIRQERQKLQAEMEGLRSRVRDASRELTNIEKQRIASSKALRELEFQATVLSDHMQLTSSQLGLTQARLVERQTALKQRLRAIYKRGQLHSVRVLLTSESFGNLITRYKYLRLLTLTERMMIDEVSQLEKQLTQQEQELRENLSQLDALRGAKEQEVRELQRLENQREQALRQYQQRQRSALGRLEQLEKDEATVNNLIASLERKRVGAGTRTEGTLTTRDLGALNWPVDGQLVFRFGPERKPNGVVLRYHGIGIAASAGTPVKAVEAGTVVRASPVEGYGFSVFLDHGGGAYTLYMQLKQVNVKVGQRVTSGQVIGLVGGEGTEHGPHLEFQVRVPTNGSPQPVDPESWLRARK